VSRLASDGDPSPDARSVADTIWDRARLHERNGAGNRHAHTHGQDFEASADTLKDGPSDGDRRGGGGD